MNRWEREKSRDACSVRSGTDCIYRGCTRDPMVPGAGYIACLDILAVGPSPQMDDPFCTVQNRGAMYLAIMTYS